MAFCTQLFSKLRFEIPRACPIHVSRVASCSRVIPYFDANFCVPQKYFPAEFLPIYCDLGASSIASTSPYVWNAGARSSLFKVPQERKPMKIEFPGETAEYRAA